MPASLGGAQQPGRNGRNKRNPENTMKTTMKIALLSITLALVAGSLAPATAQYRGGVVFEHQENAQSFREIKFDGVFQCLEYCTELLIERTTLECVPYFELPNGGVLPDLDGPVPMTRDLESFQPGSLQKTAPAGYELRSTTEIVRRRSHRKATCSWESQDELVEVLDQPRNLPRDVDPQPECSSVYTRTYETVLDFDFVPCD